MNIIKDLVKAVVSWPVDVAKGIEEGIEKWDQTSEPKKGKGE